MREHLRGDFVPPISDYSHWNEEAEAMWYAENRYDMEHWDEPIDSWDDDEVADDDFDELDGDDGR